MKPGLTVLLVLSLACGWPASAVAQTPTSELTGSAPVIGFAGPPQELDPASVPKKLLWAWTMLINPTNRHKPIPLYGYPMSALNEDVIVDALSVAAAGNVHIARLCERVSPAGSETDERIFDGRGLRVASTTDDTTRQRRLEEAWTAFQSAMHCADGNHPVIIAFTRPLDIDRAGSVSIPDAMEFVAWPGLWNERTALVSVTERDEPS